MIPETLRGTESYPRRVRVATARASTPLRQVPWRRLSWPYPRPLCRKAWWRADACWRRFCARDGCREKDSIAGDNLASDMA